MWVVFPKKLQELSVFLGRHLILLMLLNFLTQRLDVRLKLCTILNRSKCKILVHKGYIKSTCGGTCVCTSMYGKVSGVCVCVCVCVYPRACMSTKYLHVCIQVSHLGFPNIYTHRNTQKTQPRNNNKTKINLKHTQ